MMRISAALALFVFLIVPLASSDIYSWTDENGVKHFSTEPPRHQDSVIRKQEFKYQQLHQDQPLENRKDNEQTPQGPSASDRPADRKHEKVVIYTKPGCPYCVKAKAFFERHKISYTEYDITADPQANERYKRLKGAGVPLIFVGEKRIAGYGEALLKDLFGIKP